MDRKDSVKDYFYSRPGSSGTSLTAITRNTTAASIATQKTNSSTVKKGGFRAFVSNVLRPKRSRKVLRKNIKLGDGADDSIPPTPKLAPLQAHREKYKQLNGKTDPQLGENLDYTTVIHSLGLNEHPENQFEDDGLDDDRPPGEDDVAKLSSDLWAMVAEYLDPAEKASLAFSSKTLNARMGRETFDALNLPENKQYRLNFLVWQDKYLPHHLLCIPCASFHVRTKEGRERLRPAHVVNPLFDCPNGRNSLMRPPRHRITHGRNIPFSFVQLVMRASRFNMSYGITAESLNRRWSRDGWNYSTRYIVDKGRLLMRVVSSAFASPNMPPTSQRMLLYNREDYWPYFSACVHWRDGELMPVCKCALNHIPAPRETDGLQGVEHKVKDTLKRRIYDPNAITGLCGFCRPMRRCPECPTEYLVEVKLTEDPDPSDPRGLKFRHAIVVTRWSDLGDGKTPQSPQWAACNGEIEGYDSFLALGRRSLSSIFEANSTGDTIPGQRVVSLNPKMRKLGEKGTEWY